jgi:hypothetical protein
VLTAVRRREAIIPARIADLFILPVMLYRCDLRQCSCFFARSPLNRLLAASGRGVTREAEENWRQKTPRRPECRAATLPLLVSQNHPLRITKEYCREHFGCFQLQGWRRFGRLRSRGIPEPQTNPFAVSTHLRSATAGAPACEKSFHSASPVRLVLRLACIERRSGWYQRLARGGWLVRW